MKAWNEPETWDEVHEWVEKENQRIDTFDEIKINHALRAKSSLFGEVWYLKNEIGRILNTGIDKGEHPSYQLLRAWIDSGRNKPANLSKMVADYMFEYLQCTKDYSGFRMNIETFLIIYKQWEKLDDLLEIKIPKISRVGDFTVFKGLYNKSVKSYLRKGLEKIGDLILDKGDCSDKEFCGICVYVMERKNKYSQNEEEAYFPDGTSYESIKKAMAIYFGRTEPKYRSNKASGFKENIKKPNRKILECIFE